MTTGKTKYLEDRIRDGYDSEDVRMWQQLCELCKTEAGPSVGHMWTIIDIAKSTGSDILDVIKMGREVSEQKNVNEKFMRAVFLAVASNDGDDDDDDAPEIVGGVLDLTAHEELSESGSYEEAPRRLTSAKCYAIDDGADSDDDDKPVGKRPAKRKLLQEEPAPFEYNNQDCPG